MRPECIEDVERVSPKEHRRALCEECGRVRMVFSVRDNVSVAAPSTDQDVYRMNELGTIHRADSTRRGESNGMADVGSSSEQVRPATRDASPRALWISSSDGLVGLPLSCSCAASTSLRLLETAPVRIALPFFAAAFGGAELVTHLLEELCRRFQLRLSPSDRSWVAACFSYFKFVLCWKKTARVRQSQCACRRSSHQTSPCGIRILHRVAPLTPANPGTVRLPYRRPGPRSARGWLCDGALPGDHLAPRLGRHGLGDDFLHRVVLVSAIGRGRRRLFVRALYALADILLSSRSRRSRQWTSRRPARTRMPRSDLGLA